MNEQEILHEQAMILFDRAVRHHLNGELGDAIELYRRSIAIHPTAEAHTYLGWAYSIFNRYDEAIAECHKAIALDPTLGNPYNDIGAYLIEKEAWEEAVPGWKKRRATNYKTPSLRFCQFGPCLRTFGRRARLWPATATPKTCLPFTCRPSGPKIASWENSANRCRAPLATSTCLPWAKCAANIGGWRKPTMRSGLAFTRA
ncbi:MAG: tetratricopeptide repeat protein [Chloroflexi bacterium]|nr:tetratricopeptide repeat protein [Chloroflexota bacterium]